MKNSLILSMLAVGLVPAAFSQVHDGPQPKDRSQVVPGGSQEARGVSVPVGQPAPPRPHVPSGVPTTELNIPGNLELGPDRQALYWDSPATGEFWMRTGQYKLHADKSGFTYIPFLGADAPQNYPLHLSLASVQVGGEALSLDRTQSPARDADRLSFDRGPLSVQYDCTAQGVEQSFHFDPLPLAGDLVLTLTVDSELEAAANGRGWRFEGPDGGVEYSEAFVLDGNQPIAPVPVTLEGGNLVITVPASIRDQVRGDLVIDPLVTTFTVDSSTLYNDWDPDVAYGGVSQGYCVVMEDAFSATDMDIWSRVFDNAGTNISLSAYIDISADPWRNPSIAYHLNSDQFLVVAEAMPAGSSFWQIWGRMRAASASTVGTAFLIDSSTLHDRTNPDVGGDVFNASVSYFCAVWEKDYGTDHDLGYALIDGTGAFFVSPTSLYVTLQNDITLPAISKSSGLTSANDGWNIAFVQEDLGGNDNSIRVITLDYDGTVLYPHWAVDQSPTVSWFSLDVSEQLPQTHTATGEPYFLVAYDSIGAINNDLTLSLCAGNTKLSGTSIPVLEHTDDTIDRDGATIATTTTGFLVGYTEYGSGGSTIRVFGAEPSVNHLGLNEPPYNVVGTTPLPGDAPLLGFASALSGGDSTNGLQAMIAYQDAANSPDYNVLGAVVQSNGFDPCGAQYCYGHPNSTGERALMYAGGNQDTTSSKTLGTMRMPLNQFAYFLAGSSPGFVDHPGGSDGALCLGGTLGRYNLASEIQFTGTVGFIEMQIDPTNIRQATGNVAAFAGQTYYFQSWFRDNPAGLGHSNFSDGVGITFE